MVEGVFSRLRRTRADKRHVVGAGDAERGPRWDHIVPRDAGDRRASRRTGRDVDFVRSRGRRARDPGVTIPAGSFGANGTVRGRAIGTATVTASRTDYSSASPLVTATAQLNILETSLTVRPSFPQSITVRLDNGGSAIAAPAPGVIVTLVPGNMACVTTNGPVTIAAGLISVQATVSLRRTAGRRAARPAGLDNDAFGQRSVQRANRRSSALGAKHLYLARAGFSHRL